MHPWFLNKRISQDSIQLWASLASSENHRTYDHQRSPTKIQRKQTAWAGCESTTCGQSTSSTPQRSIFFFLFMSLLQEYMIHDWTSPGSWSKKRLLGTSPRSLTSCRETSLPGLLRPWTTLNSWTAHEVFVDGYGLHARASEENVFASMPN